jgi:hypothetical protein
MITQIHEMILFRALSDSDLRLLANLKFHSGRFAVAQTHDAHHHPHLVLCGPGTKHPDWMMMDVRAMLDIGDWRSGNPRFDQTLALMRYEDARHAGLGDRHGVSVLHLGTYRMAAEKAEAELLRRDEARNPLENTAA